MGSGLLIPMLGQLSVFLLTAQITVLLLIGLDHNSYIVSIAKTAPEKIGVLISSIEFHSSGVIVCLCKSTL